MAEQATPQRDQATTLRTLNRAADSGRATRVLSVTSGKGGVGKTAVVANLAVLLSRMGQRVLILDADLGLANIDVVFG
ncbi:MAG: MinD/ParA family protein, partial [Desulfobulbaceae bacterium]|nr:MinD/ParA family protein [Desulfobulbaceae bacterium]